MSDFIESPIHISKCTTRAFEQVYSVRCRCPPLETTSHPEGGWAPLQRCCYCCLSALFISCLAGQYYSPLGSHLGKTIDTLSLPAAYLGPSVTNKSWPTRKTLPAPFQLDFSVSYTQVVWYLKQIESHLILVANQNERQKLVQFWRSLGVLYHRL